MMHRTTPHYLIRDRDRLYSTIVTRRLRAMGIRDKPTAPASRLGRMALLNGRLDRYGASVWTTSLSWARRI
jgi:hypothetical protein